jgi:hypothetical protein
MKIANRLRRLLFNFKFTLPISIIVLSPLNLSTVFAVGGAYDQQFFGSNDILLYNPTDTGCPAPSSAGSATQLSGSTNEEKIYNFWVTQGLSPAQAAGITGSLQAEGGFSAFRQEVQPNGQPMPWPTGGYGIAQFTGGQRTAVTTGDPTNNLASLGGMYTTYYTAAYGGGVGSSGIPAGIPDGSNGTDDVNGAFLLVELNYLAGFASSLIPATAHPPRATGLTSDYNITIQKDQKLLPFIKTLTSPAAVAEAWTYLYEYPGDIKNTAAKRAVLANGVFSQLGGNSISQSSTNCGGGSIGTGGLTFDQADKLMVDYENGGQAWFSSHGFKGSIYQIGPVTGGYCTVLVAYFEDRFSKVTPVVNGTKMANSVISGSGGVYTSGSNSTIKPFTVISFTPLHVSIILGVNSDGSIIVDEMWRGNLPAQKMNAHNKGTAVGRVEVWSSIGTYIKSHGTVTGIAIPSSAEVDSINTKLGQYFGSGG